MICDWCGRDHSAPWPPEKSLADEFMAMAESGLVHVYVGRPESSGFMCRCGKPLELILLEGIFPWSAHPATPIMGHRGHDCMGGWAHNETLMRRIGFVPLPLPCQDPYCNEIWMDER